MKQQQKEEEILKEVRKLYFSKNFEEYQLSLPHSLTTISNISSEIASYLERVWLGPNAQYVMNKSNLKSFNYRIF